MDSRCDVMSASFTNCLDSLELKMLSATVSKYAWASSDSPSFDDETFVMICWAMLLKGSSCGCERFATP